MFVAIHCHEPLVGVPPNPGMRRKYSAATRSKNAFYASWNLQNHQIQKRVR